MGLAYDILIYIYQLRLLLFLELTWPVGELSRIWLLCSSVLLDSSSLVVKTVKMKEDRNRITNLIFLNSPDVHVLILAHYLSSCNRIF